MITESTTITPNRMSSRGDATGTGVDTVETAVDATEDAGSASTADEALQKRVFELVRARVLATIGTGGSFSVDLRRSDDSDTFFAQTMADTIAWDIAAQLAPPIVPGRARLSA